jgi:hypothetical protein
MSKPDSDFASISLDELTWCKAERRLVGEMSCVTREFMAPLAISVTSHKTGDVVTFSLMAAGRDGEGDVVSWCYAPKRIQSKTKKLDDVKDILLVILND